MRRFTLLLVLSISALAAAPAHAAGIAPTVDQIRKLARAAILVPVEWDGIWTTADSVYDCAGGFLNIDASEDTLCGGKDYLTSSPDPTITFDCTGTATATTIAITCTGSAEFFPDCMANYTMETHGTRSGDTYFLVSTISIAYSGTAFGCDLVPPFCHQINSHGTRTGPAPAAYCAIPVRKPSWGELKTRYR